MKKINFFTEGIVSDLDKSMIKPTQFVFPTIGFRAFNKNGKGMIASVVPGTKEYFNVSPGFVIISGYEFEGIGFIFSFNAGTGEGEIGTFPSPKLTSPGFVEIYRPLQNFIPLGKTDPERFTTALFNWDLSHRMDVKGKKSYDDSIDLYFGDFHNTDKVINTGFKLTGETNNRSIRHSYFDGLIDHIPSTNKPLYVSGDVVNGGTLQPGNYFLSFRYLTEDYVKTQFVKEEGPFSVSTGETLFTHHGLQEKDWTTEQLLTTDQKLRLTIENLDTNYSYIQIAITRYSSQTENAPAIKDTFLVDKYYAIGNADTMTVEITGLESRQSLSFDDIS